MEYDQKPQVNNLECFWTEIVDIEEDLIRPEEMEEAIAYMAQPEEEETPDPFMKEEKRKLLASFPGIVF